MQSDPASSIEPLSFHHGMIFALLAITLVAVAVFPLSQRRNLVLQRPHPQRDSTILSFRLLIPPSPKGRRLSFPVTFLVAVGFMLSRTPPPEHPDSARMALGAYPKWPSLSTSDLSYPDRLFGMPSETVHNSHPVALPSTHTPPTSLPVLTPSVATLALPLSGSPLLSSAQPTQCPLPQTANGMALVGGEIPDNSERDTRRCRRPGCKKQGAKRCVRRYCKPCCQRDPLADGEPCTIADHKGTTPPKVPKSSKSTITTAEGTRLLDETEDDPLDVNITFSRNLQREWQDVFAHAQGQRLADYNYRNAGQQLSKAESHWMLMWFWEQVFVS